MNRMGMPYSEVLAQRANAVDISARMQGSSGYFSKPTPDLDPRLFPRGSDHLYPEVRRLILHLLYTYWERHYHHPQWWSTVWIAGSGITRQWSGGRAVGDSPGDLDVLIGVDFPAFFKVNPSWRGTPDLAMGAQFNAEFKANLWPRTATLTLPTGGAPFEITFYVNPNSKDIRNINPYAAYNLTDDTWTVHPIDLPDDWDPVTKFPKAWWDRIHNEHRQAQEIVRRYNEVKDQLRVQRPGTGSHLNAATALHEVVRQGRALFDSIHGERHQAFGPDGQGYKDFFNFRWQAGKYLGHVQVLHQLARLDALTHKDVTARCYNGRELDHDHALLMATRAAAYVES